MSAKNQNSAGILVHFDLRQGIVVTRGARACLGSVEASLHEGDIGFVFRILA
jgi:hypothetical protein